MHFSPLVAIPSQKEVLYMLYPLGLFSLFACHYMERGILGEKTLWTTIGTHPFPPFLLPFLIIGGYPVTMDVQTCDPEGTTVVKSSKQPGGGHKISQEDHDEIMQDLWPRETKAELDYEVWCLMMCA